MCVCVCVRKECTESNRLSVKNFPEENEYLSCNVDREQLAHPKDYMAILCSKLPPQHNRARGISTEIRGPGWSVVHTRMHKLWKGRERQCVYVCLCERESEKARKGEVDEVADRVVIVGEVEVSGRGQSVEVLGGRLLLDLLGLAAVVGDALDDAQHGVLPVPVSRGHGHRDAHARLDFVRDLCPRLVVVDPDVLILCKHGVALLPAVGLFPALILRVCCHNDGFVLVGVDDALVLRQEAEEGGVLGRRWPAEVAAIARCALELAHVLLYLVQLPLISECPQGEFAQVPPTNVVDVGYHSIQRQLASLVIRLRRGWVASLLHSS
jgi:hypothetical protein